PPSDNPRSKVGTKVGTKARVKLSWYGKKIGFRQDPWRLSRHQASMPIVAASISRSTARGDVGYSGSKGKVREIGLGSASKVSLADARKARALYSRLVVIRLRLARPNAERRTVKRRSATGADRVEGIGLA